MRVILMLILIVSAVSAKAQAYIPLNFMNFSQRAAFAHDHHINDSAAEKKWFLSTYTGISTSFSFFKGGNATVFSVPVNIQLNRKLNDNLYAFASVAAAPAYINFNNTFLSADVNKFNQNSFYKPNSFGVYSTANLGLMYVNDAKTFSISGSIGIERNDFPAFPYNQVNTTKRNNNTAQYK